MSYNQQYGSSRPQSYLNLWTGLAACSQELGEVVHFVPSSEMWSTSALKKITTVA